MDRSRTVLYMLLALIAFCLVKLAFFPQQASLSLVPAAHAQGGVVELNKDAERMVSTGDNGAVTYVWDYTAKTQVRKYYIEGGKLKLKVFELDK